MEFGTNINAALIHPKLYLNSLIASNRNMAAVRIQILYDCKFYDFRSGKKKLLCIRMTYGQKNICPGKQTELDCGVAGNVLRKKIISSEKCYI
jgi:hypothetical protein